MKIVKKAQAIMHLQEGSKQHMMAVVRYVIPFS
jgi:hypothetical protein